MSIHTSQKVVSTTATELTGEFGQPGEWIIANRGSSSVYLGSSTVTTTTGFELKTTDSPLQVHVSGGNDLYAVSSTGTVRIDVFTS